MSYFLESLDNGLQIVTVPMEGRDSAAVAIWVRAGGRFESKKQSGISHFIEHMLFKGTKKRTTRQIKEEIEGVGGVLNAFTGEESTCYFAKILHEHFPKALDVLSDMVNHATFDPGELAKEKTVILEEIKMYRDLPSHYVHDMVGELMWPEQPLGRPVAGTLESVSGLARKDLVSYKEKYYHPKNLIVSICGNVDRDHARELAIKYFSGSRGGTKGSFSKVAVRQTRPRTHFFEKQTEQTHLVIGLHGLSRFAPGRYPLGILNIILGANMSSRLFEEVREKRGLAYEIRSSLNFFYDTGAVTISAGVETKKAQAAIRVVLAELGKMRKKGVSASELRRAKDYFMGQLYLAIEDTLEQLLWVGERVLDRGEVPDKDKIRKRVEAVTAEDIQRVANKLFVTEHLNLALIGPVTDKMQNEIKKEFEI